MTTHNTLHCDIDIASILQSLTVCYAVVHVCAFCAEML